MLPVLLLLTVFFPPYLFLYLSSGDLGNTLNMLSGEMLNLVAFATIILFWPRLGIVVSFFLQSLLAFVQFFTVYNYGDLPGTSIFFVLYETNYLEIIGYVSDYFLSLRMIYFLIPYGFVFWMVCRLARRMDRGILRQYILLLIIPLLAPLISKDARHHILSHNVFVNSVSSYREYLNIQQELLNDNNLSMLQMEDISLSADRPKKEVHILIIGESADRDHMSIYGYPRPTTPELEALASELFVFRDVISSATNTIPNMKALLTFDNYESRDNPPIKGTLIHYLRKAGYKTYWISNQNPIGLHETFTTIMAKNCDQTVFLNLSSGRKKSYDQILLAPLEKALAEDAERKYIFIHLIGQHFPFRLRYPQEYNIFKDDLPGKTSSQMTFINHYDNATLYNDYLVSHVIKMTRDKQLDASVLLLSDHGLEVYDRSDFHGHGLWGGLEVPFILWLSEEYKERQPQKIEQLGKYLDRRYMTDDTIYSIFDLLGIGVDSFDSKRSIFSPDFKPRKRQVERGDHMTRLDYDADIKLLDIIETRQEQSVENKNKQTSR